MYIVVYPACVSVQHVQALSMVVRRGLQILGTGGRRWSFLSQLSAPK